MLKCKLHKIKRSIPEDMEYPLAPKELWWGDSDYKDRGGTLIAMSPQEFLANAKPLDMDEETRDNIDDLKNHIQEGRELDPLTLFDLDRSSSRNSDGRHRANVALELGMEIVPVIDYTGKLGDGIFAEAPNGERSQLYDDLYRATQDTKATQKLWALSYTQNFPPTEKDENGEARMEDVINYAKISQPPHPTQKEKVALINSGLTTEDYALAWSQMQGQINRASLNATELFTEAEIGQITSTSEGKVRMRETFEKMTSLYAQGIEVATHPQSKQQLSLIHI